VSAGTSGSSLRIRCRLPCYRWLRTATTTSYSCKQLSVPAVGVLALRSRALRVSLWMCPDARGSSLTAYAGARIQHAKSLRAARALQACSRGLLARTLRRASSDAACALQAGSRGMLARRMRRTAHSAVQILQAACRGLAVRKALRHQRHAATTLQLAARSRQDRRRRRLVAMDAERRRQRMQMLVASVAALFAALLLAASQQPDAASAWLARLRRASWSACAAPIDAVWSPIVVVVTSDAALDLAYGTLFMVTIVGAFAISASGVIGHLQRKSRAHCRSIRCRERLRYRRVRAEVAAVLRGQAQRPQERLSPTAVDACAKMMLAFEERVDERAGKGDMSSPARSPRRSLGHLPTLREDGRKHGRHIEVLHSMLPPRRVSCAW
jgi:hypothetical protein